ncbi:hypothetical protein Pmani_016449 [Petrolisthes manimaculis]|uniref:Serpin domain-containing protein n=1 Tax=Petrolisthes manimaculis TaxID=1843537 RepID=A0AAE1UAI4_9EUCA|nr:hypothetical protein Pmani_016449 [Petrolisthes manimaculis]
MAGVCCLMVVAVMVGWSHAQLDVCFPHEVPEVPNPNLPRDISKFSLGLFKKVVTGGERGRLRTREGGHLKINKKEGGATSSRSRGAVQNIVISPYSVWSALVLAYLGAEGSTRRQLARALKLSSKTSSHANYLFVQQMLSEETMGLLRSTRTTQNSNSTVLSSMNRAYFASHVAVQPCLVKNLKEEIVRLDFSNPTQAAARINGDVSAATRGEIDTLVEPSDVKNAEFVLTNAVYFRGAWQTVFPAERTNLGIFRATQDVTQGLVLLMKVVGKFKFAFSPMLNASVVELPYSAGFSMLVLLPTMDVWQPEDVVKRLSHRRLEDVRAKLAPAEMEITLPKFKVLSRLTHQLKKALVDMGVTDIFTRSSDLSTFSSSSGLRLDSTIHQATITVSEEGTVAAAATALIGTRVGPAKFTANRPFVFLITDDILRVPIITGVYKGPV